jgi:hypothetical protein
VVIRTAAETTMPGVERARVVAVRANPLDQTTHAWARGPRARDGVATVRTAPPSE